ncbi:vascular endothelial growth factor receptor 1-like [Simochromis diagramma]|uniref:vascular endothelial growth factor receptor 1-like n=1 Tax=Simochromis diagramma TaxID=43689 RepID=UPI001A7E39EE|nr:vascular endothelial growth factor receptor 1-like [Simochromis diagramma]
MFAVTSLWLCWTLLSVSLVGFTCAGHKSITAESGQDVTLTCGAPNKNIIVVEWSRADLQPDYVLLYRDDLFVPDNQHPSFKNRVDLQDRQMKDGDVSVILYNVTTADTGTYECRVFMRGANRRKRAHLKTDPITTISLNVSPDHKNVTAESGHNVTLTCRAPNNNIIVVKWSRADLESEYVLLYRDDLSVPDDQHPSFKNRVDLQDRQMKDGDVSLILNNVTVNDTGTYECRVFVRKTRSWKSISSINLHVDPPDHKNVTAESGHNVTLTCRAPNNNIIVVKWSRADLESEYVLLYRDDLSVPDDQHPSFKNRVDLQDRQMKDGDVSLILKDVTVNDAGTYECRIFVRKTRSWKSISSIYLHVDPPDQKTITAESRQNVTLTCRAPNNNIIVVVEWSRADLKEEYVLLYRDEQLDPEDQHPSFKNRVDLQDRQMKDGDVSLILKNVTTADNGTYECRVFMRGANRRKRAHLKTEPITTISLNVSPGQTGGHTEDGGKEDGVGRNHHGGPVVFGLLLAVIIVVVAVVIFKQQKKALPLHDEEVKQRRR